MTLLDRISLTLRYGKTVIIIGAVYNTICTVFQSGGFSYTFMMDSFIVKAIITSISLFLMKQFRNRDAVFFYINLGLSHRKLVIGVILADYLALAIVMATMLLIYG